MRVRFKVVFYPVTGEERMADLVDGDYSLRVEGGEVILSAPYCTFQDTCKEEVHQDGLCKQHYYALQEQERAKQAAAHEQPSRLQVQRHGRFARTRKKQ
jgi:hypothetical protein